MSASGRWIDVLRDWRRIADHPIEAGRLGLWSSHVGLLMRPKSRNRPGTVKILDYHVAYIDYVNFLHLYREIFIGRVYDVALDGRAPVIVDCGSNIGMSILYFKRRYPGARITGFEPHPEVYRVLQENVERNALPDVALHRKALSDQAGSVDFYAPVDGPGALDMGMHGAQAGGTRLTVEADKLSRYLPEEGVDLLKLDIEGAEESVIAELGASGTLARVRNIICEYHHHLDPASDRLARTLGLLESHGFGYQLSGFLPRPYARATYQDVVIAAYRK